MTGSVSIDREEKRGERDKTITAATTAEVSTTAASAARTRTGGEREI